LITSANFLTITVTINLGVQTKLCSHIIECNQKFLHLNMIYAATHISFFQSLHPKGLQQIK
jgi:hypothetical protein